MAHKSDPGVTSYWLANYVRRGMCSLCGQSGILDTRATAVTATGLRCGEIHFCICPNGQTMRSLGKSAREWQELSWSRSQESEDGR